MAREAIEMDDVMEREALEMMRDPSGLPAFGARSEGRRPRGERAGADAAGGSDGAYVYAVRTEGGFTYVGQTLRIGRRMVQHRRGEGAVFTKLFAPVEVLAAWSVDAVDRLDGDGQHAGAQEVEEYLHEEIDYRSREELILERPWALGEELAAHGRGGDVFAVEYDGRAVEELNREIAGADPDGRWQASIDETAFRAKVCEAGKACRRAFGRRERDLLHSAATLIEQGRTEGQFDRWELEELVTAAFAYAMCGDVSGVEHVMGELIDFDGLEASQARRHAVKKDAA